MVRNFGMENASPLIPRLNDQNKTGPFEVTVTAMATIKSIGVSETSIMNDAVTSISRFMIG